MPPKRKRNERPSDAGANRPAPHRPSDTNLAQHERDFQDSPSSQNRRASSGRNTRRNADRRDSSGNQLAATGHRGPVSPSTVRPSSSSSQAAPSTIPSTPSAPPQSSQPRPPIPSNYNFAVLTDSRLSTWQQKGRQDVVEHGIKSRNDEDVEEISTISQEFTRAVLEGRLNPTDAGICVKQILGPAVENADGPGFGFDAQRLFLDTLSIFIDSEDGAARPQLRDFVVATEISPKILREVLDAPALQQLGLIRETFVKLGIRYATNQLYRQANYNLLREESEGYSKLAAELYRTPYYARDHHDFALVQACWERVKGLIGTFDLDVGRVLDVVIDVFSATMLRNIVFFSRFLRISSWWPRNQVEHAERVFAGGLPKWALPQYENTSLEDLKAELVERCYQRDLTFWDRAREIHLDAFFELGGRRVEDIDQYDSTETTSGPNSNSDSTLDWIRTTKTLPPCGNKIAAQLLGFKFRFYASDARAKFEALPANLYYLAAFFIKIGFISLPDLYPHLWPSDTQMEALRERREKELEEKELLKRHGNEPNALLTAGALTDDTLPTSSKLRESTAANGDSNKQDANTTKEDDETSLPDPQEAHKADLVTHLLVVGAIPEALFIIGRFPWLPEAYPDEIYPALNRILLHSINKVFEETRPIEVRPVTNHPIKAELAQDQSGMTKGNLKLTDGSPVKILKWPHPDGSHKGIIYRFYLDEWADNVPICQTVDDVFTLCSTLLNVSGVNIGREPSLVKKLAAIGVKSFLQDQSPGNAARWQDLLRRTLVPSLCLCDANVDAVGAVWDLLKYYPTQVRYNIYSECYEGQISRIPAMAKAFRHAKASTIATLKRLSYQNISSSAKKLAKVALSSPGIVCKVALEQIEAYTNLIEAFVECTKYFTEMGHDILVWSLLSSLGGKERSRTQEASILLTSRWLQALSKFSGRVFRRYSNMDPTPVIYYVNDQITHGNPTDLIILRELITSMGGIVSDIDFTDAQLFALSGGEVLRRQMLVSLGDKRYESAKSAARLMKALVQTDLACRLLTNMAQYRQSAIYHLPENETHIKYLATVIDDSQQALVQYVELLRNNLTPEQFDALIPNIPRLMTDFGLDANLAFMIGRASLQYFIMGPGEKLAVATSESTPDAETDSSNEAKSNDGAPVTVGQDGEDRMAVDAPDVDEATQPQLPPAINGQKPDRFLEVLSPIVNAVRTIFPAEVWGKISPEFFVLFWSLQTGDLVVPMNSYEAEITRVEKQYTELKRERGDMSTKKKSLDALIQLNKDLSAEASTCHERVSKTKILLIKQSPRWFVSSAKAESIADTFIEECLIPRILLSPSDADFCHRMIRFMHSSRVPNFRLMDLYDRFFGVNRLRLMIFGCTVREAEFLGHFIKLTLGDLAKWHKDKDVYVKEAIQNGKIGFATAFEDNGKPTAFMEHDQFRDLLWTWHRNLATALRACLTGTEWMHIRNAITVLKAGLEHFPAVDFMGRQFLQILGKIAEREDATKNGGDDGHSHRVDLSVTANTATSALKKYSPKWVMVQAFRSNTSGDSAEDKKSTDPTKPGQPGLRPNAPDFKPTTTGMPTRIRANAEEEDGEVNDVKASAGAESIKKDTNSRQHTPTNRDTTQKPTAAPLQKIDSRPIPSRSSTPRSIPPAPPASVSSQRVDLSRPSTLAPAPGLPSRPEVPFPAHFTHDKFGQITTSTHPRDHRESRDPREVRAVRDPRELRDSRELRDPRDPRDQRSSFRAPDDSRLARVRDQPAGDRRIPENIPRESPRSERDRSSHRPETGRRNESNTPDRDGRGPRDRSVPSGGTNRGPDATRAQRDNTVTTNPMPPPPQPELQGPTVNPERARLINADRPDERSNMVNPARAALINEGRPSSRQAREDSRDRNSSRPVSPRRDNRSDPRPNDPSRDRPHRVDHPPRDHWNEPLPATGPKGSRIIDHEGDRGIADRSRDPITFQGPPHTSRSDSDHGRLNNQDPEYGRLSSIPSISDATNPPEGPRGRGRNSTRAPANNIPGRPDPRFPSNEPHRPTSPDRHHPPTGPASSRPRRGQTGGQYGHGTGQATSPTANNPSTGIHPERLRQLNPGSSAGLVPSPQPTYPVPISNPVSVHPDRMGQISASPSGSHQGNRSTLPPLQTSDRTPMSGPTSHRQPSGGHPGPFGSDANIMAAPTGPANTNERSRAGGGRRQLSGINTILSGGSPTVRSRGSRSNLAGSDAQVLTGASPVSTPVHERPDPNLLVGERNMNGGERSGRNDHERGRRDHSNADRSLRSSRRSSRDRSTERDQRPKEHRDYRDRKSNAGLPGHGREGEMEPPRRSGRDSAGIGREPMPGAGRGDLMGNPRDGPREPRHRGDGGSGRHEDYGRGRGGGGPGGGQRGGDDRRDARGGDDRGRKRRSDDFGGPTEKRQRR
ncbi:transcription factor/nuclear export subunit protein 2-domain-containing protein [Daldinia decipiens]|uniref:transcription factor/nuclear export subunit protein 2-domain-containing protein n=1 Tax=Daldinia decipiens TaxID=326647 RepID=UPI0020C2719B|nr:transcription factor/nuclear export subunit protein 2-domain-containing protein [Daldinia decipiens]KAI1658486.1 transcription factor/nuclear export subunit protein 2-domain-containing protein [Daldinia decipiens]